MRLLHAESIRLRSFEENATPPYAILSHTWGDGEVSFQDIHRPNAASKAGYKKIKYACRHALREGLDYVWVDTCCIDKTSSVELSEAINSMFRWYQNAVYCYAYLADVPDEDRTEVGSADSAFARSRWFTRGWTLQELLAPSELKFFSSGGRNIGSKNRLRTHISRITGISEAFLNGTDSLSQASVARRMSWASRRTTTRTEDLAYCLLGIFGISMPMLYGEGDKAFVRLQEEIMKSSDDQSLFAWGCSLGLSPVLDTFEDCGPFARHPAAFEGSGDFVPDELGLSSMAYTTTNKGLQIHLHVTNLSRFPGRTAVLACRPEQEYLWLVGFRISFHGKDSFIRQGRCFLVRRDEALETPSRSLYFLTNYIKPRPLPETVAEQYSLLIRKIPPHYASGGLCIWDVEPRENWNTRQRIINLPERCHVIIHLWKAMGEGFAIVLSRRPLHFTLGQVQTTSIFLNKDRNVGYLEMNIFKEFRGQRLNSDSIFPECRILPLLSNCDITVAIGERPVRMSTGINIHTIDIELATNSSTTAEGTLPEGTT
jgi:hypothetical protein